jgi:histidinol-phosphate/aromatic aminotransferase/cobyric acid decarboxylase-like protein
LPWNVGTIPMWAALAALEDREGLRERVEFNNREVQFIEEALCDIPGLTIFHSHANYILFDGKGTGKAGTEMVKYAEAHGLIFRPETEKYGSDGFWRLTIGSQEENRMAVNVIREFYTS